MRNHNKKSGINYKLVRGGAASVLAALLLSSCTSISVPDAINPTKWDFFADDAVVPENADATTTDQGPNQGLSADVAAPAPAPANGGSNSGLSADNASGNYASPPIERQGKPADYLSADATKIDEAPAPQAVAVTPVRPASAAIAPAPSAVAAPVRVAEAPPGEPQFNAPAPVPAQSPATIIKPIISNETPPPPPLLRVRGQDRGQATSGRDTFDTVVISSNGIEDTSGPVGRTAMSSIAPTSPINANVRFPVPGSTTVGAVDPVNVGGMLRVATIYFDNNSDSLNSRDKDIVAASAQLLSERGGSLYVVGHASSRTSDMDYIKHAMTNFQISTARANQVASALKSMGVDGNQLRTHALSDTVPLYFEVMPSGEAGNRRVEIYLAP
ncbi:MAG: OmpA family protein [Rhodospirillaceae bacterium]|nr:OmpA family protein [Rhodospirillaceae bacterium]